MVSKFVFLVAALSVFAHALPSPQASAPSPPVSKDPIMNAELQAAEKEVAFLQKHFTINKDKPPYGDSNERTADCQAFALRCPTMRLYDRDTLLTMETVTVSYTTNVDARTFNPRADATTTVSASKSDAISVARTEGWSIGATISAAYAPSKGEGGVSLSFQYQQSTTTQHTSTKLNTISAPCPPRTMCTIETRAFFAKIKGKCHRKPRMKCAGDRDVCSRNDEFPLSVPKWGHCREASRLVDRFCERRVEVPCEVTVPIFENDGKTPRSTVIPLTYRFMD